MEAPPVGIEPTTPPLGRECSNPLSYGGVVQYVESMYGYRIFFNLLLPAFAPHHAGCGAP